MQMAYIGTFSDINFLCPGGTWESMAMENVLHIVFELVDLVVFAKLWFRALIVIWSRSHTHTSQGEYGLAKINMPNREDERKRDGSKWQQQKVYLLEIIVLVFL